MSGKSTNARANSVSDGSRPKNPRTIQQLRLSGARHLRTAEVQYIELTATVAPGDAEHAADVLRAVAGGGVSIETAFVQRSIELGAEPRTDAPAIVRAYVADRDAPAEALEAVRHALREAAIPADVSQRAVREEDWAESWKEHFHIERFGRIVIVPSWREYAAQPDDVVVTLDPGMAFGTGQHETTRMCLEALSRHLRVGMGVLDAGCGSGILAIAAAKLGASAVLAIDIDPDCVRITSENASANGVDGIVRATLVSLDNAPPLVMRAGERFDIIVANIVASTIIDLAPFFAGALAPDGRLIASGIIGEREPEVRDALDAAALRIEDVRTMGEWRAIEARPIRRAVI